MAKCCSWNSEAGGSHRAIMHRPQLPLKTRERKSRSPPFRWASLLFPDERPTCPTWIKTNTLPGKKVSTCQSTRRHPPHPRSASKTRRLSTSPSSKLLSVSQKVGHREDSPSTDRGYRRLSCDPSCVQGGVPIGACLIRNSTGEVLGVGRNKRVQKGSATLHGETDCLENIGRLPANVYRDCTMVTTLSPCTMVS